MTSKEALKQIKHCGNKDWRLAIEDIEKDLKILEIFKNNHHLVIHKDDDTFILSFNVNVNEIDDFKEWLENDR